MKKRKRNSLLKNLIICWHEIAISDKALIIIMAILLIQCIINLFNPEPTNVNSASITVIIRTTVAAIFGYFLSENFLKQEININKTSQPTFEDNTDFKIDTLNTDTSEDFKSAEELDEQVSIKDFICNKNFQVIVALTVCVICLISLIVAHDFQLIPEETSPTVIQFRDLISSCVGFLLGHTSHISKKKK